jgi:hypothetical protein
MTKMRSVKFHRLPGREGGDCPRGRKTKAAAAALLVLAVLAGPAFAQAPQGLVALWSADGNAKDGVGTCNGALNGGGVGFAAGKFGQAFQLDGHSLIQMPSRTWGFSTKGTITVWIKTDATMGAVVSLYHGRVQDEMLLEITEGKIGFYACTREFVYAARQSETAVNSGNWIFIAGVLDGDTYPQGLRIYVNGREEKGKTLSAGQVAPISDATPRSVRIGWRTNEYPPEQFKGLIDDVGIFNRALSLEEIAGIYRGGPLSAGPDIDGADDPLVIGKDPFAKPSKYPRVYIGDPNPNKRWEVEKKSLPPIFTLTDQEAKVYAGRISVDVEHKTILEIPVGKSWVMDDAKDPGAQFTPGEIGGFIANSGFFSAKQVGKIGIELMGHKGGIGKIFVRVRGWRRGQAAVLYGIWVVIVKDLKLPPDPTREIPRADLSGKALRKDNGAPVAGARISLVLLDKDGDASGTYLEGENLLTGPDGSFRVRATGLPRGRFEILIQLLGLEGIMNTQDLWPYQQYVIDLSPELARQGVLDVGTIYLERVSLINFARRPQKVIVPKIAGGGPGVQPDVEEDTEEPEIAFSSAAGVIHESYPKAWEDTRRVPPFSPTIAFKEPPQSSAKLHLDKPHVITRLSTFHWYGGNGANSPGTIEIRKTDGGYSKSWPATGEKDFTRSVTVYWVIEPNELLEAGDYQVSVTPQNTWSFNARSRLEGIMKVEGYETVSDGKPKPSPSDPCAKPISRNATITSGKFRDGQIESKNQSDFFTFSVAAGQNIVVSIQAEPRLGVRADLLDPGRTRRGRKTGRMSPGPATFKYKAPTAGEYTIRVWVKNGQCKTGSYTVGVTLM